MRLAEMTTDEVRAILARAPSAVLVPVGSVEPHGPHLPLETDTIISCVAAERACAVLRESHGVGAVMAPAVPYGVTDFAEGFPGAVGVPADVLTALLRSIAMRLLGDGWSVVCFVNNHLEPAHDAAVRAAGQPPAVVVASPLTRRWGRTLTDEYKSGACHAGQYETSLVLAAGAVVRPEQAALPAVQVSLSEAIRAGKNRFKDIGMERAYTGAPALATVQEGEATFAKLVEMVVTEIMEALETRA